ncbi:MAG: precorrin-6y C5,15-methyltransferase (decarboxylating) subunit CbiE [Chloroflexi bacterium]|nr:precorrin-6y C5,15-methyltransferase (decarboxylating) subunit CbiE [Chloroflexota bacterium]
MDNNKLYVIGMLDSGQESLTPGSLALINQAAVLIGSRRLLSFFPRTAAKKHVLKSNLAGTLDLIKEHLGKEPVVLLASGDPNFFGIGRYLVEKLGPERLEIIPNLTSLQLVFARLKQPWDDAVLLSAHARPIEAILTAARRSRKIGILTDDVNTPAAIATALLGAGIDHFDAFVAHNLGGEEEDFFSASLEELSRLDIPSPNVVLLLAGGPPAPDDPSLPVLGLPEEAFDRRRPGLITKMEVRAIVLAKMALSPASAVWDIGAGSGSVAVEAARLCPDGRVCAIEKEAATARLIKQNYRKFGVANLTVIEGEAPEVLATLEEPDAIFVGGSGGRLEEILKTCAGKLKPGGRLVANVTTLENLHSAQTLLKQAGLATEVTLVSIFRSQDAGSLTRLEPLNPVFIVSARKPVTTGLRACESQ